MSYPARMILRTRTSAVSGKNILRLSNGQMRRYHQAGDKPVFHWEVCLSMQVVAAFWMPFFVLGPTGHREPTF